MKINKVFINVFLFITIITLLTTILSYIKKYELLCNISLAVFSSSLLTVFTSLINYLLIKRKTSEEICSLISKMDNNSHTEIYHPGTVIHLENLARTVSTCTDSCFNLLITLNDYKTGLFFLSKENKIVDSLITKVAVLEITYHNIGTLLKTEKEKVKSNSKKMYKAFEALINFDELYSLAKKLLKSNKSNMLLEKDYSAEKKEYLEMFKKALFDEEEI